MKQRLCLFLIQFILVMHLSHAQSISIDSDYTNVSTEDILVLKESAGQISFDKIIDEGIFFPALTPINESKKSYYWVKLTIEGQAGESKKHVLKLRNHSIDFIEFFRPINDEHYEEILAGTQIPFQYREYQDIGFVFDIDLNYEGTRDFYFRAKSKHPIFFDAVIQTQSNFTQGLIVNYLSKGIIYSALLILLIYSIFVFFSRKKNVHLLLSVFILLSMFLFSVNDGSGFAFVWTDIPVITEYALYATPFLVILPFLFFSREYLNLPKLLSKLDQFVIVSLILFLITTTAIFGEVHPFIETEEFGYIIQVVYGLPFLLLLIGGVLTGVKGETKGGYFTIGFLLLALGYGLSVLVEKGLYFESQFANWFADLASELGFILFTILVLVGESKSKEVDVSERRDSLADENYKELQKQLLPTKEQLIDGLKQYFVYFKSKNAFSGNFYHVHTIDQKVTLLILDCKASAEVKSLIITLFQSWINDLVSVKEIVDVQQVVSDLQAHFNAHPLAKQSDVKLAFYVLDRDSSELKGCSFGINCLLAGKEEYSLFVKSKEPFSKALSVNVSRQNILEGQKIYFFTDGYARQLGGKRKSEFGEENLAKIIQASSATDNFGEQYKTLKEGLIQWKGNLPQTEDILIIGFKI